MSVTQLDFDEIRPLFLDHLLTTRLMRQGLILGCEECSTPSFVSIDDLAQTYRCSRCGAANEFSQSRWRDEAEPRWFYDLHTAFRNLISSHGDVPLRAAQWLKSQAGQYVDTAEVEIVKMSEPGQPRNRPSAEADLIALVDDELVVVEAKSNTSSLPSAKRRDLIVKRIVFAEVLRADTVLFASSAGPWQQVLIDEASELAATRASSIRMRWLHGLAEIPTEQNTALDHQ